MGWVEWVDVGVWWEAPCTHMHIFMLNMINMDSSMGAAICNFYTGIFFCYALVYMCMHVCACGACEGYPQTPTHPHIHKSRSPQITKYAIKLE